MADIVARDSKVYLSAAGSTYTEITGVKECGFSGSVEKQDKTDHDSGAYRESAAGRSEHTMSISGNYEETDAGQALLRTAYFGGTTYYFKYRPKVATGAYEMYAQGFVTSYKVDSPNDGYCPFTAEIQLTGTVTWTTQS